MIWVTAEDVVAIHSRIIQVSGGIDGLRDRAGLKRLLPHPFNHLEEKIFFQLT